MSKSVSTVAAALFLGLCLTAAKDPSRPDRTWRRTLTKPVANDAAPAAVANLPDARGRSFRNLDAYLAHLRAYAATVDRPWWREVRPNLFRLERGNLRTLDPPPLLTREQLERRFGFRR